MQFFVSHLQDRVSLSTTNPQIFLPLFLQSKQNNLLWNFWNVLLLQEVVKLHIHPLLRQQLCPTSSPRRAAREDFRGAAATTGSWQGSIHRTAGSGEAVRTTGNLE